jgi:adenine-specific DNA-methyltransferase
VGEAMAKARKAKAGAWLAAARREEDYRHPEAQSPLRPDVGTQAQFRKKKPPVTYRYDSSLAPALDWDGQNAAREQGEAAINEILDLNTAAIDLAATADDAKAAARAAIAKAKEAADRLKRLGKPFLNWTGKAERLSFDVPTLPLFVHERLSTKAIIQTLTSHEKRAHAVQADMFDLFGDPRRSVADQVLKAYEYKDKWVNRLILGDSLVVMNSLLHYEGLGGQVQVIYVDPPYGVKFGSNFQPFVRKRNVTHNDDEDMTREPEMVKAYRDTWEIGLHSYLTYLRDRLLLARDLLHPSGSVFVQISNENLHHVRELMDEVFGEGNAISLITFVKTSAQEADELPSVCDYLLWYARDKEHTKYRKLWQPKEFLDPGTADYNRIELPDGSRRRMTNEESAKWTTLPGGARAYTQDNIVSQRPPGDFPVAFEGEVFRPITGYWKTGQEGMRRLIEARRIERRGRMLRYVRFFDDFQFKPTANFWSDVRFSSRVEDKLYVVQTSARAIERCILMTTDPGDLVLDPTCGSGTTAYVAEEWGRRWITIDTSRIPLALARQRVLTATYPYYELKEEPRGPAGGFVYKRKQNKKGEEVGGIVPHVTLKSIANNEPPQEEVLVDRPETIDSIVRVAGPFTVEATIPSPVNLDGDGNEDADDGPEDHASYLERMLEVLRKSPVLQVGGGKTVTLRNIRPPAKSLALSAEAMVDANGNGNRPTLQGAIDAAHEANTGGLRFSQRPIAIVFGPENSAVSEKLVFEAAREARAKSYTHLYVIGFAIQANARHLIETCEATAGIPATFVSATHDLVMGDLLKTTRASQIFSVCGMPEIKLTRLPLEKADGPPRYQVELLGLDVFDPATMEVEHRKGDDIPAWLLDTDYNGLVFHGSQVFFPRTSAWDSLKKALKATHDESVWDHLAGTTSAPFEGGEHAQIAVKVIDDRGNELLVVKYLKDAAGA